MKEKSESITAEDILEQIDKLQKMAEENMERKRFEGAIDCGEITEAHFIVHPKVAIYLKKALHAANIDAQIIITRLAPLDKIYVLTDRELIAELKWYRRVVEEARQQE